MIKRKFAEPAAKDGRTKRGAAITDIESIIKRATTGALTSAAQPRFMDLTAIDYMAANNRLVDGRRAFMQLNSKIRARFQNDPYQLLRFLDDPENHEEAVKLGLKTHTETPPKRIFDMTEAEWLQMEEKRQEAKSEANPRPKP